MTTIDVVKIFWPEDDPVKLDVTEPSHVEVLIRHDSKVIWVNVDGICRFRACRIGNLVVNDERTSDQKEDDNARDHTSIEQV